MSMIATPPRLRLASSGFLAVLTLATLVALGAVGCAPGAAPNHASPEALATSYLANLRLREIAEAELEFDREIASLRMDHARGRWQIDDNEEVYRDTEKQAEFIRLHRQILKQFDAGRDIRITSKTVRERKDGDDEYTEATVTAVLRKHGVESGRIVERESQYRFVCREDKGLWYLLAVRRN